MYALTLVLFLFAFAGDEPAEPPAILMVDEQFAEMDTSLRTGWLGLTEAMPETLVAATVEYLPGHDEDRVVLRTDPPRLSFLFRNIPELEAGPVVPAQSVESSEPGLHTVYRIGERTWTLRIESDDDEQNLNLTVTLLSGDASQVLFKLDGYGDEPNADIWWAGDLDRDGRLDLIAVFSDKYSYHPISLYLSSRAKAGELVGKVVTYELYGC